MMTTPTTCTYCGDIRPEGEIDWPRNHLLRTGHEVTAPPPVDSDQVDR